jgi:aminopeptidase 2
VFVAHRSCRHIESSYTSPLTQRVVPLRAYATHDHIAQAALGLETKVRTMPIYEKVFDVPYPLPKLDTLVASAFSAGAMENWGLITGRTSVYLYDPLQSGIASKKRVIGVQSHEVSHQWFGNVVTFAWWDNLWLNER